MEVDMSLDDIIKTKKIRRGPAGKAKAKFGKPKANGRIVKPKAATTKKHGGIVRRKPAAIIIDARNKIIQKHRSKIHDARDKLAQIAKRNGDVRKKLLRKGIDSQHNFSNRQYALEKTSVAAAAAAAAAAASQRATQKPLRRPYKPSYIEHDIRMNVESEYMPALRRTVKNDVAYASRMPPLPTFKHIDDPRQQMIESSWSSGSGGAGMGADPFDCYEVPLSRPYDVSEPRNLNRQLTAQLSQKPMRRPSPEPAGRYRYNDVSALTQRVAVANPSYERYRDGNGHLSYEMRSRLHHLPDPNQSMGIFSNPYANRVSDDGKQKQGYRIVVSNLHSSVSQNDVKELFEDIGQLLEARLVKTGVAEVIFADMKDAEAAVETYHNRQLDGQPMKCLLVNPRPSGKPTAPAIRSSKSNLSKSGKVEIDIDALHTVLFRRN